MTSTEALTYATLTSGQVIRNIYTGELGRIVGRADGDVVVYLLNTDIREDVTLSPAEVITNWHRCVPLTPALAKLARETCVDVFTRLGDAVVVATVHQDDTVTVTGENGHEGKRYPITGMTASNDLIRLAKDAGQA